MVSDDTAPQYPRSALITIDVQRDFLDGQPFEIRGTSAAVPAMGRLVRFFRLKARPIVHMVRLYRADGSNVEPCRRRMVEQGAQFVLPGSVGSQLAAPLLTTPETTRTVLARRSYEASERDFRIVVIEDALSGFDDRARTELESIGVRVLDTESFLREAV
ncbi:MAG: hypothetical protein DMF91_20280 [Acidobacteria bacterium]|nr:MAG: hypothetical protein DMF91_20280 [Acidobacteriota bacterium]